MANLGTKSAQHPREVRFLRYLHSKPLSQKRRQSGWYKQNLNKDSEFEAFLLAVLETNFQLCTKSTRPKFAQGTPQILTCYWLCNSLPSRDHHQRLEVQALQRPPKAFDPWKGSKDASHWMLGWEHMCCVCLCPSSTMEDFDGIHLWSECFSFVIFWHCSEIPYEFRLQVCARWCLIEIIVLTLCPLDNNFDVQNKLSQKKTAGAQMASSNRKSISDSTWLSWPYTSFHAHRSRDPHKPSIKVRAEGMHAPWHSIRHSSGL